MSASQYEDDRTQRRNRAGVASGLAAGAGVGVLVGTFTWPGVFVLGAIGAVAGGLGGRLLASHISPEEWDPALSHRPYVGANSPDDDIAHD
jgi:hypothetical protein